MGKKKKIAIIIGGGPAGLTAGYELITRTDIKPIIFEQDNILGGISRTVAYKGNRIDIGGHRFFSKSDRVGEWWKNIMPLQGAPSKDDIILQREIPLNNGGPDPEKVNRVLLVRQRLSRIYYERKFFDYPLSLNFQLIKNLGLIKMIKIGFSYIKSQIAPIKPEISLKDFFINRFGEELYLTFFKDYTEKVWGIECDKLSAEWGAQRVKGVSVGTILKHAISSMFINKNKDLSQKNIETSLIGQFMYPKYGPGQMWTEVANLIKKKGGEIFLNMKVIGIEKKKNKIVSVKVQDLKSKRIKRYKGDYFFSTMPIRELIASIDNVPKLIKELGESLLYRDFITVGLLLKKFKLKNKSKYKTVNNIIPDNWIYIQEPDVKIGRLQIFNNWSPYMVKDLNKVWIGLEYFCNEGDELWNLNKKEMINLGISELEKIGMIDKNDVLDGVVIKIPKTYPVYYGKGYENFSKIREFFSKIENIFLIGRNGMHRYNNQDHSMLSAMIAVDNIIEGRKSKKNIWEVNTEKEYHEEKK